MLRPRTRVRLSTLRPSPPPDREPALARWKASRFSSSPGGDSAPGPAPAPAASPLPRPVVKHLHLQPTAGPPTGLVKYAAASAFQDTVPRAALLRWKHDSRPDVSPPCPRVLSFVSEPTYTLGRREAALSDERRTRLQQPLRVRLPRAAAAGEDPADFHPEVLASDRGGLTTYHGPGQLVIWPVIDLKSPLHANFTVRSYARVLENTTRELLAARFGVETYLDDDEPGVWAGRVAEGRPRKIAAMGIYLRRHVTGLGVAINVDLAVRGGEDTNPWARFVPCGLEGKSVTSVASELGTAWASDQPLASGAMEALARDWAATFASKLRLDRVESATQSI